MLFDISTHDCVRKIVLVSSDYLRWCLQVVYVRQALCQLEVSFVQPLICKNLFVKCFELLNLGLYVPWWFVVDSMSLVFYWLLVFEGGSIVYVRHLLLILGF